MKQRVQRLNYSSKYRPLFPAFDPATGQALGDGPSATTRYIIVNGGRGSGKSFAVSSAVHTTLLQPDYKWLYTRWTLTSAKDSIIPEFTEKMDLTHTASQFKVTTSPSADIVNTITGSQILFRGIKTSQGTQTAKLKSIQGINGWVLDEAEEMPDEDTFDKIDLSIRDPRRPNLIILCFNPAHKRHWIYKRWWAPHNLPDHGYNGVIGDVTYISTDYRDNTALPRTNPEYIKIARRTAETNWRKYRNIWLGGWISELEGALWSYDMIHNQRVTADNLPEFKRVVIPIDPSVTGKVGSDETGIVPVAEGADGHFYVLCDKSGVYSTKAWAKIAIQEYRKWMASRVVGEVNNGGDLVEDALRNVDRTVRYKSVRASRGKYTRAEPIAALYELGLVHHVGQMQDLESELMSYKGPEDDYSPGRLDSLVWGLSEVSGINPNSWSAEDVLLNASQGEREDW